jgi:tRNA pseudouridine55 synthase
MLGFLNLNKPAHWTSHDCVAKIRKILKTKRVGHGGTLDPLATGVLPIAVGKATRLLPYLQENKAYQAIIRLGVITTSDDLEGEILQTSPYPNITLEQIKSYLPQFLGKVKQTPPLYSAIQKDGKRLYDLARRGEIIEVPSRIIEIFDLQVLDYQSGEFPELKVNIKCGSGTYIRAIARDLGQKLGIGGTLAGLIRTESCGMLLENSLSFEDILAQEDQFRLISPHFALQNLDKIVLSLEAAQGFCQGKQLSESGDWVGFVRVEDELGNFLGIGEVLEGIIKPKVVLWEM